MRRRIPCVTTSGHRTNYLEILFFCEVDVVTKVVTNERVPVRSCAVIVATDRWKNLASLVTTLVSPVKFTELGKNQLTNQLTE